MPTLLNDDGIFFAGPTEKDKTVTNFVSTLWEDRETMQGGIPRWVHSRWNVEVLDLFPLLYGSMILAMALKMGKGKMCANDRVAVEMVIALGEFVLDELAQCFRLRALNHASEDSDTVWDEYGVILILKKVAPTSPGDLRLIEVLPCLSKIFFAAWVYLMTPTVTPLTKYQFAFRENTKPLNSNE